MLQALKRLSVTMTMYWAGSAMPSQFQGTANRNRRPATTQLGQKHTHERLMSREEVPQNQVMIQSVL